MPGNGQRGDCSTRERGACAAQGASAATREKPASLVTADRAQGPTWAARYGRATLGFRRFHLDAFCRSDPKATPLLRTLTIHSTTMVSIYQFQALNIEEQSVYLSLLLRLLNHEHGLRIFASADAEEFQKCYQEVAATGYVQAPFSQAHVANLGGRFSWVRAVAGNQVIGTVATRQLGSERPGGYLSDIFRGHVLTDAGLGILPTQAWLSGRGPMVRSASEVLYQGGGWVHPDHRGKSLIGLLLRILNLHFLLAGTQSATLVSLVMEPVYRSGLPLRVDGTHARYSALVLDGYFPVTGTQERAYAVWASVSDVLSMYRPEYEALRSGARIAWLPARGAAAPQGLPGPTQVDQMQGVVSR